jgi:hypothetical protein
VRAVIPVSTQVFDKDMYEKTMTYKRPGKIGE